MRDSRLSSFDNKEQDLIMELLGRTPNDLEIAIIKALWSEHCSYKSSKHYLQRLPHAADFVLCGTGENAGAIDVGDGLACVFKIESHNHPSFIEPYQGAATGVGGILRDIFAMGAHPKALMNVLAFGEPSHPRTRYLLSEAVRGIADYGNAVGIPNVGGECRFDKSYNGNILVNVLAAGIAPKEHLSSAAAKQEDAWILYAGSRTGRDGIKGAEMASRSFTADDHAAARPSVQGGDPFAGRQIMKATLEIITQKCALAVQDLGAAGLTSAIFEMAAKGGTGINLQLDKIPLRNPHLTAREILLSESQERMLFAIDPQNHETIKEILNKWDVSWAIIGTVTKGDHIRASMNDQLLLELPTKFSSDGPIHDRPKKSLTLPPSLPDHHAIAQDEPNIIASMLFKILNSPDGASKKWIFEQYDNQVMTDSVQTAGGDGGIIRIHDNGRAIALSCDSHPRATALHPRHGTALAASECYRNLCATGAKPLAFTNNLNFGSPEDEIVMASFALAVEGLREASLALECPVVSGNVSFYNETDQTAIMPTAVIGGLGVLKDMTKNASPHRLKSNDAIFLIGVTKGELGASLYLSHRDDTSAALYAPPIPNFEAEKKHGQFMQRIIQENVTNCSHDISDGGLILALVEMALASSCGMILRHTAPSYSLVRWFFCESPARYLVATSQKENLLIEAQSQNIPILEIGVAIGQSLSLPNVFDIPLEKLNDLYSHWFEDYMKGMGDI